jgi:hypothetical protein
MNMNSITLKEKGFSDFIPLKQLTFTSLPYNRPIIFVLADYTLTGKPSSDILYIGKSKKPTKRILGGFLSGYGGKTTRKINSMLLEDGYLEKIVISWMQSENTKLVQQELKDSFKKEHGEYPKWNVSKKTTVSPLPKPKTAPKVAKQRPPHK